MIVGTAGHIDHGKTALVRALTGVETDRLREEKERGITIDLGFAYTTLSNGRRIGFVDVPGHERFVHTMLAGAGGIDFALLVIAADDGIMPQTREHLAILSLLGIGEGAIVLSKADLADAERLDELRGEIRTLVAGSFLDGAPILAASTRGLPGTQAVMRLLEACAEAAPSPRGDGRRFRLAVDRSFVLPGTGTVVTGTVLSGHVRTGDALAVSPSGLAARLRSLHRQDEKADEGRAGDRCALNLAGDRIARNAVRRGDMIVDPALDHPTDRIDAELTLLPGAERPVAQWFPVRLHHAAADIAARIVLLGDRPVQPGETGYVQLVLDKPLAAAVGDRFVIRDTSARHTLGGGRFLDLRAPARRRRTAERLAVLSALAAPDAGAVLSALLALPPQTVDIAAFARDRALTDAYAQRLVAAMDCVEIAAGPVIMPRPAFERLGRELSEALATFHADNPDLPGMGLERLRLAVAPRLPAPVFRSALATLREDGVLKLDGAWVAAHDHAVRLSEADEMLWKRIAHVLNGSERFRPPRTRDLAESFAVPEVAMRTLLKRLGRMGELHEVAHDHFFPKVVLREMVEIMRDIAAGRPGGQFTAADLRDRLDNGRKVAIQILEFFDRHGLTLRRGDQRRLNPHRLDLFD
ncbi:selenocysteine-specific translation elongation factor [Aureimonas altamirensis]|uniref:selenocysteine-specific translation elongation factor n=1 Tax=Aureimonas altamirensis TaxID=370622 RepID=UPI00203668B8|nr:selenocysteine-specific translation elongation factor [Aureimonas altamirensis]